MEAHHGALTAQNYDGFSLDAMWFLGSGIAVILAGFLNIAAIRVSDRVVRLLCLTANLIFTPLFSAALYLLAQPQVFLGAVLFLGAAITATMGRRHIGE